MKERWLKTILLVVVLAILVPAVHGQSFGRIEFTVTDADGNPLAGVKVTATSEELRRFRQEKSTNKNGKVTISVVDATKRYQFVLEHLDFPTIKRTLKPILGDTTRVELELTKEPAAAAQGQVTTFTPAETAFNQAADLLSSDDTAGALALFQEALSLDDSLVAAHSALARVHLRLGQHEQAIQHAEAFVAANPNDPSLHRVLYDAHRALGNDARAAQALQVLEGSGQPQEVAAMLYNEGVASLRLGDDVAAETRFEEALELDAELAAASKALAVLYHDRGQWKEAAANAETYLATDPQDTATLRVRWDAYLALGDSANEEIAFEALAAADPVSLASEFLDRGETLFNAGEVDQATAELERALRFDPSNPRIHYYLGLCHLNAGRNADAKQRLQTFLELAPDDPEAATAKEMISFL